MKKNKVEEWNERRFKKLKGLADSMSLSDELEKLRDSIKYGLNLLNLDLILTKRFLGYVELKYKSAYHGELDMEEEDEKMMDELDAMHDN